MLGKFWIIFLLRELDIFLIIDLIQQQSQWKFQKRSLHMV